MFGEVGFLHRFEAARRAGFEAVEFLFPYEYSAAEVRQRLDDNGLRLALFNMPPGDWGEGERGLACLPGRGAEFRAGVAQALDYAAALGCPMLHCMAGIAPPDAHPTLAAALYTLNLAHAAEQAKSAGVRLVIEPINQRDMPGYHLTTPEQAVAVITALGADLPVGLQFDVYHMQMSQGDVTRRLGTFFRHVAHVQIADVPGRHEPGSGEIRWEYFFARLDALGYAGWVGCEYRPAGETTAGLGWLRPFGVEAAALA